MAPEDSEKLSDIIAQAQAATDQMAAIYNNVWMPYLSLLDRQMKVHGLRRRVRDAILIDVHRQWTQMLGRDVDSNG